MPAQAECSAEEAPEIGCCSVAPAACPPCRRFPARPQAHRPVEQCLHALLGYATSNGGWLTYLLGSALLPGFRWVLHACPGHAPGEPPGKQLTAMGKRGRQTAAPRDVCHAPPAG